jgi:hypothetical protein
MWRRAVRIISLLLCLATLVAWHRSYAGDYGVGLQSRRVSRSQGGRWEYRFSGLAVNRGVLGVGTIQERSGIGPPVTDYRYDYGEGFTAGANSSLWREPPFTYTVAGFGLRRCNIAPAGFNLGYSGFVGVVPLWLPVLLFAWPVAAWYRNVWREARQLERANQGLCPMCGYDLRGTLERCPECGAKRSETWPTTA